MSKFPSNKSMILSLIVLLFYFNISFFLTIDKRFALQQYQWNQQKQLDSVSVTEVIAATGYNLKLVVKDTFSTPSKNTYILKGDDGMYYFRYEYLLLSNDTIDFKDVHWLKGMPNNLHQGFSLIRIDLPLKQQGHKSAITIGDDNFCRHYDEEFRKIIALSKEIYFKGNQKDVLGYPMASNVNWSSQNIINVSKNLPDVDYIIILFSWHPHLESLETYLKNLSIIKKNLLQKHPQKIFWIVPPAHDQNTDTIIEQAITRLKTPKIVVLNPNTGKESKGIVDENGLYSAHAMKTLANQILLQL